MTDQNEPGAVGLKLDPLNTRRHGERNRDMIKTSIEKRGFARSLVTANDGTIIAGNATYEAALAAGLTDDDMIVVESDGTKIIAIRRTDVEPGTAAFHELSVGDNRTALLAEWDAEIIDTLDKMDVGIAWDDFFTADEFAEIKVEVDGKGGVPVEFTAYDDDLATEYTCPKCGYEWSGKPK